MDSFNWTEHQRDSQRLFSTLCEGDDPQQQRAAIAACIEKAVWLLPQNIHDTSRYFLCEWNGEQSLLSIVVSDDSKRRDAENIAQCRFAAADFDAETIRLWIRDYLTTCAGFMHYSLVAMFHTGNRSHCELL